MGVLEPIPVDIKGWQYGMPASNNGNKARMLTSLFLYNSTLEIPASEVLGSSKFLSIDPTTVHAENLKESKNNHHYT